MMTRSNDELPRMEIIARVTEKNGQILELNVANVPTDGSLSTDEVVHQVTERMRAFADDFTVMSWLRDTGKEGDDAVDT